MIPALLLAVQGGLPPESEYVTVRDGRLVANGQRVRLWCAIGSFPNPSGIEANDDAATRVQKRDRAYRDADAILDRFTELGFNGIRFWRTAEKPYVKGDGSEEDVTDYFVAAARKRGFRIWVPGFSQAPVRAEDVDLVNDPSTADTWRAAVREGGQDAWIARVWDPRLEEAQRRAMSARGNHRNLHSGLRWADDPVFAIWELTNEEWWMQKMVGGRWRSLPPFFRTSLEAKWHDFLRRKYGGTDGLRRAWGFLLPGENLQEGGVAIAPLAGPLKTSDLSMDPQARLQLEQAFAGGRGDWTRDDFPRTRGADVIAFFLELQLAHKRRLQAHLKSLGKSARLGPTVFDTGIGYEIQSQYLHQNAEAVAHDAYINGFTNNRLNPRYPFYSGLEEWPKISQDVPWLEHNRVVGKPYLCYETQIMQPAKYRAEFPLRILALAAIQDWDAVCWHYWGSVPDITANPRPFDKPLDVTTSGHPQGYHYTYDAVQNAMMRAAAAVFRTGALEPAAKPTTFVWGRRSLYDPASMDYAGSYGKMGLRMLPTTYTHGVRIEIDPSREDDEVRGPTVDPLSNTLPNVIQSTPQIRFDMGRGGLRFDAPGFVGFAGFFSRFGNTMRFRSGVSLSDVRIVVPKAMPYPEGIAEERYLGFGLATEDGQPLAKSRKAVLALSSTSFNSGFRMLMDQRGISEGGTLPVLEARVAATVRAPALAGMTATFRDWNGRALRRFRIGPDGTLKIPSDVPVWVTELSR